MTVTTATAPATFYVVSGGNDIAWRSEWPCQAVGGRMEKITTAEAEHVLNEPHSEGAFPWRIALVTADGKAHRFSTAKGWARFTANRPYLTAMWTEFPKHEGAAVFVRPDHLRAILAKAMRLTGIRTVAETDDNYFADPSQNLFMRQQKADEKMRLDHAKSMVQMDANVFSTAWLRDRYLRQYRSYFGSQGLPEMHVCRNNMPRDEWPDPSGHEGSLRVGFMGSPSHVWDIHTAYASFHAAKEYGCHTTMIGYNPARPDPDVPDEFEDDEGNTVSLVSPKSRAVREKWSTVVCEHIRWIDPSKYHRVPLPLDIGLAPLLWNDFNAGRSDCKLLEYTVSGAAIVASNHPVFTSGGWRHEVNCLLAGSQEEMGLATVRLIRDRKLRESLVEAAQEMVREERNEETLRKEWGDALAI